MVRNDQTDIDERWVQLIAARVADALRDDLQQLLAAAPQTSEPLPSLSVEQVASQLRVARSTVYAHWREWGGYKLGVGEKAPIRFDSRRLPSAVARSTPSTPPSIEIDGARHLRKRRRRRDLLGDAPRIDELLHNGS